MVAEALTEDEDEIGDIALALLAARGAPDSLRVGEFQEALGRLNAWYPISQRNRMQANGDKADWQFYERYLAGHIDSLKSVLIASMWLGKIEVRLGG